MDTVTYVFRLIIVTLYDFMVTTQVHVFGIDTTLWGIFMYSFFGSFFVWFIRKIFF